DDANVHFDRAVSADPLKFPFLKDTQKLDLEGNRHVSDFIQEDSSTVCLLESTDAGLNCTGESSFYMAEKLGLQQVLGNCATVDTYELLVFSRAVEVNGFCNEFLSSTSFTLNQNGAVQAGNSVDQLENTFHCPTRPNDVVETVFFVE